MFNILGENIKPGTKFIKDLRVTDAEGRSTILAYYVIAGNEDGPHICITSGVHGTEYPGIGANIRLYHTIQPEDVHGVIYGVFQCNFESFRTRTPFINPLDSKNLNDTFPGNPDGTITERLCDILVNEFACKADYHIDMHSGDSIEYLHPYAFYHINHANPEVTEISHKLAQVYGLGYVSSTELDGEGATDRGNFYAAVAERGVPSIQPEIGGVQLIEEETLLLHYNGAKNVMMHLGILEGTPCPNPNQTELIKFYRLKSQFDGIYHCYVSPGEKVEKGKLLARITDYHGEVVHDSFYAQEDAVILWVMSTFATCKGDNLMAIGVTN